MTNKPKSSIKLRPRSNYQTMRQVSGDKIRRYHNVGDPISGYTESRKKLALLLVTVSLLFALTLAVLFLTRM